MDFKEKLKLRIEKAEHFVAEKKVEKFASKSEAKRKRIQITTCQMSCDWKDEATDGPLVYHYATDSVLCISCLDDVTDALGALKD